MADNGELDVELDEIENIFTDPKINKANKKLSVERIYQKKTQLQHILLRPDTYIGSVEPVTQAMWVYDGEETGMINREVTFVPGLYKIFDEILVNAADNKQRDKNMDCIKIDIDPEKNKVSIWNNGKGIPVVEHRDEKMFVPSLIFGHLLTSSNYNDEEKKVTGGRNGYGAKLCNIFSNKFTVETSCKQNNKCFRQTWSDNMSKASDPKIVPAKGEDFTCVTFYPDLKKFKMEVLDKDIVALMSRRAFDVAGCTKGVRVQLNGKKLPVKGFKDYVDLYTKNKEDENGDPLKIVYENVNDRWEVAATISDHGFQQVSFVNSIATTKGGRHVDYIVDQLTSKIVDAVKKKNKGGKDVRAFQIKTHIWVFVNCLIENPTFDSQTKENMTLQIKSFGSKCALPEKFITSALKCGVVEAVVSWVRFKAQTELDKKCSGKKHSKLKGIPKLEDANDAGTRHSIDCTLILTEGDSAKSLAVSGLGVVGRDKFGVFPLKGKMLNVREASYKQILENAEINNIIKIMGLQYKKKYETIDDLKTLRYGRLMIMADQDHDGSHIKGLLINFIHHNWPSLLRLPFLEEFITPIVKASKGKVERSFFSLPEFEEWKQETANWPSWKVKYYKGLGTSTAKEAKEYFSDMVRHRIKFQYSGTDDDHAIQLAFSKKMVDMRKEWLTNGMEERKRRREMGLSEMYLYGKNTTHITYNDFVNKELILFSNMDNERSIPSLVDGFKPGQRKVLFTCFKRNDKRDVKVAQLAGSVAEHSAYHHGEVSLTMTIINLAQNFVGSNNINLLQPLGQFGTRLQGGKDAASPRYIFTMLSPLAKLLFSSLDEPLLNHLHDDNQKIEPEYYVPIIPMILVNGADGIGTAWSTRIPNFNPRQIVKNLYRMLDGDEPGEMLPWFKNFRGTIDKLDQQHFMVSGEIARLDDNKVEITELPTRVWTQTYKENVLEPMLHGEKVPAFITDYKEYHTDTTVRFVVTMSDDKMRQAENQGFHKTFKLQSSLATSTMVLFDHNGCLRKYETPIDILKEFYEVRYKMYEKRKDYLTGILGAEALKLSNQARFILEKIEKKLIIEDRRKVEMIKTLQDRGYDSDPVKAWKEAQKLQNEDDQEAGSDSEEEAAIAGADYDYLLGMTMWSLTREKKEELLRKRDEKTQELETLQRKSSSDLWREDLKLFMDELDKWEKKEKEDELTQPIKAKGKGGGKKKTVEDTKPSMFGERVVPRIDLEARRKAERKPPGSGGGGGGEAKKGRKKKDVKVEEDEDDPLVPLSERIENSPKKEPKAKRAKKAPATTNPKPARKSSPMKGNKKSKKNPWSDSESNKSDSEASDKEADDYIPPEKRETAPRRAAAKAKYTFDSEEEKSNDSDLELHDHDPEGMTTTATSRENKRKAADSTGSDESDEEETAKPPKKMAAPKAVNGAQSPSPVASDSDDSDMFSKEKEEEKPHDSLFDELLGGAAPKEASPKLPKSVPVKDTRDSDSDSSIGLTIESEKPVAAAKKAPPKKRPRKKKGSDSDEIEDDDFVPEKKKAAAPKKPAAPRKKAVKKDTDGAKPPKSKKPKKKAKSESENDEFDDDKLDKDDSSPVTAARARDSGRSRAPVKYRFDDDESSDGF